MSDEIALARLQIAAAMHPGHVELRLAQHAEALRAARTVAADPAAPAVARLIAMAQTGAIAPNQAESLLSHNPDLNQAVVRIGEGAQTGDISTGDIAGGNIIKDNTIVLNVTIVQEPRP